MSHYTTISHELVFMYTWCLWAYSVCIVCNYVYVHGVCGS